MDIITYALCKGNGGGGGGSSSFDLSDRLAKGTGTGAIVEGFIEGSSANVASGDYSHAEGYRTTAAEMYSHAEGYNTHANQQYSHAEGQGTTASGLSSHAEGEYTVAKNRNQHVFGAFNIQDPSKNSALMQGTYVEIVGNGTSSNVRSNARTLDWSGNEVLAGKLTVGAAPTANMDVATKQYVDNAVASSGGGSSFDLSDRLAKGTGTGAVIEGLLDSLIASGNYSHAEGIASKATKEGSHAEGDNTTASGNYSHAEGDSTTASGHSSHAEGAYTTASYENSHAEGAGTTASASNSHAEGSGTVASGTCSHAEGASTIANHFAQHAFGMFNIEDTSSAPVNEKGNYIEIVGNGTGGRTPVRSNARTLDWSGNEWIAGNFFMDGSIITMNGSSGAKYQIVIDDSTDPSNPTLKISPIST